MVLRPILGMLLMDDHLPYVIQSWSCWTTAHWLFFYVKPTIYPIDIVGFTLIIW